MGLKALFKQKIRELKCDHYWRLTKECTVREWDSPHELGYDWHREWVCDKCDKTDVTETHRPIPSYAHAVTDENGVPVNLKENEVQEKPFAVYDCYQPVKARELFLKEDK